MAESPVMLPPVDLLVIGAQKSGTTTIWQVLRRQNWFLPAHRKELHHFNRRASTDDDAYRRSFPAATQPGQLRGEVTPNYLGSYDAPGRIRAHNPDFRLIVLLRDPVQRAISAYKHARRLGAIGPNESLEQAYLHEHRRHATHRSWARLRWDGLYGRHLLRYLDHFSRDQLHVAYFEELVADPRPVLDGIWDFLGVEGTDPGRLPHANAGHAARLPLLHAPAFRIEKRLARRVHPTVGTAVGRALRIVPGAEYDGDVGASAELLDAMTLDYADEVRTLAELLGQRPPWPRFRSVFPSSDRPRSREPGRTA